MITSSAFTYLAHAITASRLLRPNETLVLGVSGGPDSMALLEIISRMAQRYGWAVHAAHLNHLLRGKASDGDEACVRRRAQRLGIPLHCERVRVSAYAREHRLSVENAARQCRYGFFEAVARKTGADKIALAHTADDQAETLLWRLLRGSVQGLAGMPSQRPLLADSKIMVVRPFLSVRKREILAFLHAEKIPFRLDQSNRDTRFTRNKIRRQLIPLLEKKFNPQIVRTLNATAQTLSRQKDLMESLAQKAMPRMLGKSQPASIILRVQALSKSPPALQAQILKTAFIKAGGDPEKMKSGQLQRMLDLLGNTPGSKEFRVGALRVRREQKLLVFQHLASAHAATRVLPVYTELLDKDSLALPLRLRPRRPGDRYQPIGLAGSKKIKDILIEQKIPLSLRDCYRVLVDKRGRICWLMGYRIAEFCKIRPETAHILRMRVHGDKFNWNILSANDTMKAVERHYGAK